MAQQSTTGFLVLFYNLVALVPPWHTAPNLALDKPYTVSSLPSYRRPAPPTVRSSLTDGK